MSVETDDFKGHIHIIGRNLTDLTVDSLYSHVYTYGNVSYAWIYSDANIFHNMISKSTAAASVPAAYKEWAASASGRVTLDNVTDKSVSGMVTVSNAGSVRDSSFLARQRVTISVAKEGSLSGVVADTTVATSGKWETSESNYNVSITAEDIVNTTVLSENGNATAKGQQSVMVTAKDTISGSSFKTDNDMKVTAGGIIMASNFEGESIDASVVSDSL